MTAPDENARFEELMAREFPDGLIPVERARPILDDEPPPAPQTKQSPEPAPPAVSETTTGDPEPEPEADQPVNQPNPQAPSEGFRSWAPPEEPDEPFVPPAPPPGGRWSTAGIAGTVLVVLPVLLVVLYAFGLRLPGLVSVLAVAGFVVGVVLLLQRLGKRPPTDGDGAVV